MAPMTDRDTALALLAAASTPDDVVWARRRLMRAAGGNRGTFSDEEREALNVSRAWIVESARWRRVEARIVDPTGERYAGDPEGLAEAIAELERAERLGAWRRAVRRGEYPTEAMALEAARAWILAMRDEVVAEAAREGAAEAALAERVLRVAADGLSLRAQPEDDPSTATWCEMVRVRPARADELD